MEEVKTNIKLINSNMDRREHELMKVFDCNPDWPICLFNFTFKNRMNQYLAMVRKRSLSQYIQDKYFMPDGGVTKIDKRKIKD